MAEAQSPMEIQDEADGRLDESMMEGGADPTPAEADPSGTPKKKKVTAKACPSYQTRQFFLTNVLFRSWSRRQSLQWGKP
jgi:hypothetical protein